MEVIRVAPFLDYLDRVHARTRRIVECVSSSDLEWRAGPNHFTAGELIRHLAGIERYMYGETVHGRPSRYAGLAPELAGDLAGTVEYYDRLHAESRALFAALTDARLAEKCQTPAGTPITVGKWLRAMIEHESHHRGQLYFILGLRGVSTPPLYGLTSEEVQARSHE